MSDFIQAEHKLRPLSELKLWDKNPRRATRKQMDNLRKKIERLGGYKALITKPDGTIIGGNMRYRVLKEMNVEQVWCSVIEPKDDAHMIEIAISDNETDGEWVEEELAELIHDQPIELDLYSVHLAQPVPLGKMLEMETDAEEDEAPEVDEKGDAKSKAGEIYQLGRHRLMCGDSTKTEDLDKLMGGVLADMVFTDLPYNVNWDYRGKFKERGLDPIFNDNLKEEEWDKFAGGFISNMVAHMKPGAPYYMCSGWHSLSMFEKHLAAHHAQRRQLIVWAKNQIVMGKQATDYHRQHEQIWYGWKEGAAHTWYGGRKQSDLWPIDKVHNLSMVHSTEKPVALPAKAIKNSSKKDDIVLELFGGSGSTIMAAEQTDRICYALELDPKYCDVIRKRYAKSRGKEKEWEAETPVLTVDNSSKSNTSDLTPLTA